MTDSATPPVPPLHVVTDDAVLAGAEFEARARTVLESGGPGVALHLRGHGTSGGRLYALARALLPEARATGTTLLANDRVDVARAAGLDGVQLGERSLPPEVARSLLGRAARIGRSVHDPDGAARAEEAGADFVVVGTIFATASHPGREGAGPDLLSGVADRVRIPVVAIGGVTPARVAAVTGAGARGVAVLRGVWTAADPAEAVERYLSALDDALENVRAPVPADGRGRGGDRSTRQHEHGAGDEEAR